MSALGPLRNCEGAFFCLLTLFGDNGDGTPCVTFVSNVFTVYNLYAKIRENPAYYRQFNCRQALIAQVHCHYQVKYDRFWSDSNYMLYILEGRRMWHTAQGSFELNKGNCVFVKKGACMVEHFTDSTFCVLVFFLPDEFICEVLQSKTRPLYATGSTYDPIIPVNANDAVQAFFQSMLSYFDATREPDPALLELKFKELILTLADNPENLPLIAYFASLLQEPQTVSLQRTMEANFCYNLGLEEYARLCMRSLSAFKRDFQKAYNTTPGRWLMEKRLGHALHLLTNLDKTVTEAAFESGFENVSHFSRSFRQRFGCSPMSVRQQSLACGA